MQQKEQNIDFTLISSYIDNECNKNEESYVLEQINCNSDFKFLYLFEKNFTYNLRKYFKSSRPSEQIINNISDLIDRETNQWKRLIKKRRRRYNKYYVLLYPFAAVLLILIGYYLLNSSYKSKDFILQSHYVFDKIENNQIDLEYMTSNAEDLQKELRTDAGFNVFIPDVKDAALLGGYVKEVNGVKVVHFIHKKDSKIIYTMQISQKELANNDKLILSENHKQEIASGKNWIECEEDHDDCTVIWFKNDVICSSVSKINAKEISSVLTNYK